MRGGRTMLAVVMNGANSYETAADLLDQGFAMPVSAERKDPVLPPIREPRPAGSLPPVRAAAPPATAPRLVPPRAPVTQARATPKPEAAGAVAGEPPRLVVRSGHGGGGRRRWPSRPWPASPSATDIAVGTGREAEPPAGPDGPGGRSPARPSRPAGPGGPAGRPPVGPVGPVEQLTAAHVLRTAGPRR